MVFHPPADRADDRGTINSMRRHAPSTIAFDAMPVPQQTPPLSATPSTNQELVLATPSSVVPQGQEVALPSSLENSFLALSNKPENTIMIAQSSGIQIGNNIKMSIGLTSKSKKKSKSSTKKVEEVPPFVQALMARTTPITTKHLINVRIGAPWRRVMRHLEISDPDIENKHEEFFHQGGPEEVVYQLLRLWVEDNASSATVDKLSRALWLEQQMDALLALHEAVSDKGSEK